MLDFSRNSDHLYRLYITGDMMLRDGLEDIPRRYPDMDFGLIHTGWHDLLAHGGHDDGPDGFGANGTISVDMAYRAVTSLAPDEILESDRAGQSRSVH